MNSLMKYKSFIWPRNPKEINITVENDIKDFYIPKAGSVLQNYRRRKRVISGTGEFFGEDCFSQYENLFEIFKNSNGSSYLVIPNIDPFPAVFKNLKLLGDPSPNVVTYSFTFWEDTKDIYKNEINIIKNFHVTYGNESLWNISLKYNLNINDLLDLNSFIKDPKEILKEGLRISLR